MTDSVTFRLPYPPTVNHYWVNRVVSPRGGRRKPFVQTFIGKRGKQFRSNVEAAVVAACGRRPVPVTGRLQVEIVATMPDRRKRDIDNALKATLDALTHAGVWGDDGQVDDVRIVRGPVKPPGWLDVTVTRIEQPQTELFS